MANKIATQKKEKKVVAPEQIRHALFLFQSEKLVLPRNGKGKAQSGKEYRYVTLDDMIQIAGPVLQKYGIGFTQLVQTDVMETKLFHVESGTELTSVINLGSPNNMQDYGGRITYAKRYALGALLGLSSEEDVDATPIPEDKKPEKSELPDTHNVQHSDSYNKAKSAIDTSHTTEALTLVKEKIEKSPRLSVEEKAELQKLADEKIIK